MFPTSGLRTYNQHHHENSENVISRKPGQQASTRKPLSDRVVNQACDGTKPKVKPTKKRNAKKADENLRVDCSSYKEDSENTWPMTELFSKRDVLGILRSYANKGVRTPPPRKRQFDIDDVFLELPEGNSRGVMLRLSIHSEVEDDVPLPMFDINDFCV